MLTYKYLNNKTICFECDDWQNLGEKMGEGGKAFYKSFPALVYRDFKPIKNKVFRSIKKLRTAPKKKACPYCRKKYVDVNYHVSVKHGEKWDEYIENSKKKGIFAQSLKRCSTCGALAKDILKHIKLAHINK